MAYSLFATVSVGTLNGHTVAVLASIHPLSRSAGTTKRYGLGAAESGSEGKRATKGGNFLMDKCREVGVVQTCRSEFLTCCR